MLGDVMLKQTLRHFELILPRKLLEILKCGYDALYLTLKFISITCI